MELLIASGASPASLLGEARVWMPLMVLSALTSAAWISLGQRTSREGSSERTGFWVRLGSAVFLLPLAFDDLFRRRPDAPLLAPWLWAAILGTGLFEGLVVFCNMRGVRRDYYATAAMLNAAGVFTALLAPLLCPGLESFAWAVLGGSLLVLAGAFVFYRSAAFSPYGLAAAGLAAVRIVLCRQAIVAAGGMFVTVLSFFVAAAVLVPLARLRDAGRPPARLGRPSGRLALMALLSAVSSALFYYPVEAVEVSRLQPFFLAVNIGCAFLFGFYGLRERAGWPLRLAGGLLVAAGGALVAFGRSGG